MIDQELLDAQKELTSFSYSQEMAYANLIIGGGYAGFFATWAFTRKLLPDQLVLWSALFISISLISFVGFEVYKTYHISRDNLELGEAVSNPEKFETLMRQFHQKQQTRNIKIGKIWTRTFGISVITGFSAGGLLMASFIVGLLRQYWG